MNIFPPPEQRLFPFHFYADMRHSNPIAHDDRSNMWAAYRYYDAKFILGDSIHFSSPSPTLLRKPSLLRSDPPYQRTLKAFVESAFTTKAISILEPRIERITHDLLNQVIEKGCMDLINDLAYPLVGRVIAELLGFPLEDKNTFHVWGDRLVSYTDSPYSQEIDNFLDLQREMDDYFNRIIDKIETNPESDLIGSLKVTAVGHYLSRDEILAVCSQLTLGHLTTVNLIGNMILSLLQNLREFEKLKKDRKSSSPSQSLISSTIEETLRYKSPTQALPRITRQEVTIGGQKIPSGQGIFVMIGSANHDESIFPEPEKFNISRFPNGHSHLGFGHGIHFCPGAPLARSEAGTVLKIILDRLQELEIDGSKKDTIKPLPSFVIHGVSHLPLRFTPGNLVKPM